MLGRLDEDTAERAARFVEESEACAEVPFDELLRMAAGSPRARDLFRRVAEAVADQEDVRTIGLLARAWVNSCCGDRTRIDDIKVLVGILGDLEPVHLTVLEIIARPGPTEVPRRDEGKRYAGSFTPGERIKVWETADIVAQREGLGDVVDALLGKLQSLGLIYDEGVGRFDANPMWLPTPLGKMCTGFLQEWADARSALLAPPDAG